MKKILVIISACFLTASVAYGQTTLTDQDEKNLAELSKKLVRMKRDMDAFMKELSSSYSASGGVSSFGSDVRIDIVEKPKEFIVKADLPGMDKDKIVVTLDNNRLLKIAGTREMIKEETSPNMVRQERMEGRFERVVELPKECRGEDVKASYANGVLEIVIPKKEETKPETVKVNVQ